MKLGIFGYGKMGIKIHALAKDNNKITDIMICDKNSDLASFIADVDVILDFSIKEATRSLVEALAINSAKVRAILIGTTALDLETQASLNILATKIAVLHAPNVSIGANLLSYISAKVAEMLGDSYDIDILEQHHRNKVDAPSGTALMIGENIASKTGGEISKSTSSRKKNELMIHSIRSGNIFGDHEVQFCGEYDSFSISHRIESRDLLAISAIKVALWLDTKPPALYKISDILGIK